MFFSLFYGIQDRDGQLSVDELQSAIFSRGRRTREPSAKHVAALVAGMDRVGKRSVNLKEFEVRDTQV